MKTLLINGKIHVKASQFFFHPQTHLIAKQVGGTKFGATYHAVNIGFAMDSKEIRFHNKFIKGSDLVPLSDSPYKNHSIQEIKECFEYEYGY